MPRRTLGASIAFCLLGTIGSTTIGWAQPAPSEPVVIAFADLAASSPTQRFSDRLLALRGQRVRLTGYMAQSEQPLPGAFFLCPVPTHLDEGGAGTGDLPPDSVRVIVPSLAGQAVPFVPRPLEVTGILDLGYREEPDGQVSWVRLTVPAPTPPRPVP